MDPDTMSLQNGIQALLDEADYFGLDGEAPVPTSREIGHPRFALVTGENASGKSFLVRGLAEKMRAAAPKLEFLAVTMSNRTKSGFERVFIFGDESRSSSGQLSLKAVRAGIGACRERGHDHVLILDEPDIGLDASYAGALGSFLAEFVETMPEPTLGFVLVTHSLPMVRNLAHLEPTSLRVGRDQRPLAQWIEEGPLPRTSADIVALSERSSVVQSGINKVRNAREASKAHAGVPDMTDDLDKRVVQLRPTQSIDRRASAASKGAGTPSNVAFFVDAGTRAIRQEAIRRVRASRIFRLPGDR